MLNVGVKRKFHQILSLLQLSEWTAFVYVCLLVPPPSLPTQQKVLAQRIAYCIDADICQICTSWISNKLCGVTFSDRSDPFSSSWLSALETLPEKYIQIAMAEINRERTDGYSGGIRKKPIMKSAFSSSFSLPKVHYLMTHENHPLRTASHFSNCKYLYINIFYGNIYNNCGQS